jgi:hypothetical protein
MGKRTKTTLGVTPAATADSPSRATIARRKNAKERRSRVLAEGGRRVELLLAADAARALSALEAATGGSATAVVSGLLLEEARRRR